MSVMDVRKNSRYLDNLRSELGANSAAAMVREAPQFIWALPVWGGGGGSKPLPGCFGAPILGEMSKYKRTFA